MQERNNSRKETSLKFEANGLATFLVPTHKIASFIYLVGGYMELIKPSPTSRYFIRGDLFKGHTPEDSYWLGVIMADGCIRVDGNKKKTGYDYKSYKITLAWQEKDFHHLTKFRDYLGDTNRKIVANHSYNSRCHQVNVQGSWLGERVKRYGIVPSKTTSPATTYEPPDYIREFLCGWFDGDGYFNAQNGKESLTVTGEHTSLLWFKSLLEILGYDGTSYVKKIKDKNASRFIINGRLQCLKFYDLVYSEDVALPRKWEKFKRVL